jgi:hypothetical protein
MGSREGSRSCSVGRAAWVAGPSADVGRAVARDASAWAMGGLRLGEAPPVAGTAAGRANAPQVMLAAHALWAILRAPAARLRAPCARSVLQTVPCTMLATEGDNHGDIGRANESSHFRSTLTCSGIPLVTSSPTMGMTPEPSSSIWATKYHAHGSIHRDGA